MDVDTLIVELDAAVAAAASRIAAVAAVAAPGEPPAIADLLAHALRNELEASEEAALFLAGEKDIELKMGYARQCGDEARHYGLLEDRLRALGGDPARVDVHDRGPSPMFRWLRTLETTAERIAAGPYAREGIAVATNAAFSAFCGARGDAETARLYRDVIGPDEASHHAFGRRMLRRYAVAPEDQERVRAVVARAIRLAEGGLEAARTKAGVAVVPGC